MKNASSECRLKVFAFSALAFMCLFGNIFASWSDDFEGGPHQAWTVDDLGTASTYLFQNNQYELHTEGPVGSPRALASYVSEAGYGQAIEGRAGKINASDRFVAYLLFRANTTSRNAYVFGASSDGVHFWFGKLTGGAYTSISPTYLETVGYNSSDFRFEAMVIGNRLLGKVWNASGTKPDHWQINATDSSYGYGNGGIMLGTYPTLGWNTVQVAYKEVSFAGISQSYVFVNSAWAGSSEGEEVEFGKIFGYNAFATVSDAGAEMLEGGTMMLEEDSTGVSVEFESVYYEAGYPLNDSNFLSGAGFISLNSSAAPEFNGSARITMHVNGCPPNIIVFNGFPKSREEIMENGTACTECTIISCYDNIVVFDVPHFSGYAANGSVISTGKYTPVAAAAVVTEGGNVTDLDIRSNISTEKWAGYWGNISGGIVLAQNSAAAFYEWAWSSANGGEVCALSSASGFEWATTQAINDASQIDSIWGFDPADTDAASQTFNTSCAMDIVGFAIPDTNGTYTGTGGFQTCALVDQATPLAKQDFAFCTNITQNGALFNGLPGDYELLAPTNETDGAMETHYFWLELN